MVILFDADGVLFDTEFFQQRKKIIKYFQKRGKPIINSNGYNLKDTYGCTADEEIKCWIRNIIAYSYFFPPRPDMAITIRKLQEEGNKVYCVTAKACALEKGIRGIGIRILFETGLRKHGIHFDGIFYCALENSAEEKVKVCKKLKGDVFIEDNVYNIEALRKVVKVLCMHTRNNSKAEYENVVRIYSADDLYREIKIIEADKTGKNNFFSNFHLLTRKQKMNMRRDELAIYYQQYYEYLLRLPYDEKLKEKQEKNYLKLAAIISTIFRIKYGLRIIGLENIPQDTNYTILSNHLCKKDMFLLATAFRNHPWHSLNRIEDYVGWKGIIFRAIGATFVDRFNVLDRHLSNQQMLKKAVHGAVNLIFPEGTYNKTTNLLAPFQGKSGVNIGQIIQIPILPVAITNTYGRGEKPVVRIGKAINLSREYDMEILNQKVYEIMADLVKDNKYF